MSSRKHEKTLKKILRRVSRSILVRYMNSRGVVLSPRNVCLRVTASQFRLHRRTAEPTPSSKMFPWATIALRPWRLTVLSREFLRAATEMLPWSDTRIGKTGRRQPPPEIRQLRPHSPFTLAIAWLAFRRTRPSATHRGRGILWRFCPSARWARLTPTSTAVKAAPNPHYPPRPIQPAAGPSHERNGVLSQLDLCPCADHQEAIPAHSISTASCSAKGIAFASPSNSCAS